VNPDECIPNCPYHCRPIEYNNAVLPEQYSEIGQRAIVLHIIFQKLYNLRTASVIYITRSSVNGLGQTQYAHTDTTDNKAFKFPTQHDYCFSRKTANSLFEVLVHFPALLTRFAASLLTRQGPIPFRSDFHPNVSGIKLAGEWDRSKAYPLSGIAYPEVR
jgi:hypothetical protein